MVGRLFCFFFFQEFWGRFLGDNSGGEEGSILVVGSFSFGPDRLKSDEEISDKQNNEPLILLEVQEQIEGGGGIK